MNNFNPKTVTIGNQVWMAENLNVDDGGEGIYHNQENNETYYTWEAAMRVAKSIHGWHLSSALEWNKAARACGAIAVPWEGNPGHYDYEFAQKLNAKLDIKLAGVYDGRYYGVGSSAYFWTSTEGSFSNIYYRYFSTGTSVNSGLNNKNSGCFSIRLVKDN